ncbi:MAG: polyribonucleotide nucleotidyltransferase [Candidatus Pacebacteria bacterium]|nr:polyribonucleotide nucleotidyltransferase [Candidatus Paceibacterota bacterium]
MESKKYNLEIGGKNLEVQIRHLAEQANADVLVSYGDTEVLATCVMSKEDRGLGDFFPLTVDYEERYYAAGKIRGPKYIKRESRPSDEAILNARLIDRAIRPLFPQDLPREVQLIITVLSWDAQNDPDLVGLISASLALSLSDIPWQGPLAAARIGKAENKFILNPSYEERGNSPVDFIISAVSEGEKILINMMEGGFEEADEKSILEGIEFAKGDLKNILDFQKQIIKEAGKEKIKITAQKDLELEKEMSEFLGEKLEAAFFQADKSKRQKSTDLLEKDLILFVSEKYPEKVKYAQKFFEKSIEKLLQENILKNERRPDDRKIDEIREISCEVGLLPRTHGSGLFCRGQTKALSILTLGAPGDQQILEGMEIVGKKRFMHHYNFPPYSAGEIKPMRGPGRREIGHGMLAEKALLPQIPSVEDFPYTIRVVTEILSSNGSTSMASISASSLALMDAGVPIKRPAAGIAMGIVTDEKGNYKILTDIQGPEDHHGGMDFKIAGTKEGITAIQMDVKIKGIDEKIIKETLERGKKARLEILDKMEKVILKPRENLSQYAPRIITIQINPDKIREVIGPGGKVINEIIDECGVAIDIEDSGKIFITGESEDATKKALSWIENITREVKVGETFQGKVKRILAFGAFVEILPGQEGLVHISQLADYRVNKVEDIVKIGQIIPVKVISIDEQGRINLSLKEALSQDNKKS